jgi:uncharacterized protein (PEP-CTERM system associated)
VTMNVSNYLWATLGAAALASSPAEGQPQDTAPDAAEDRAVSFNLGSGIEYDSNVALLDLDATSNAGDRALLLDFGIGYDKPKNGPFDVQAGYAFSESVHDDVAAFDVRTQRGSATLSYDLDRVDVGAMLQYAHAELDGEEFLTLSQVSPYLSKLIGRRLFLRFAYAHSDKDFAANPGRAATAGALSADAYVFLDGLTTYLVLGYRYDDEDAVDEQFDYAGDKFRVQLTRRLTAGTRELTLRTSVRTEARNYERPTLSIGAPRRDDRRQLEASLDVPMTERVTAQITYTYADNRSNLPSVDFDENVLSVSFSAAL